MQVSQGREEQDLFTLLGVGDVSPYRDDPPSIFRYCGDVFRNAGLVFGQMECPMSDRGTPQYKPGTPMKIPAKNVSGLGENGAGFDVMSFAGNHTMDYGPDAFFDTIAALQNNNIAVIGVGANIEQARRPAILERCGTRVGFLGYNSVVFPGYVAQESLPGCAPLRTWQFYQPFNHSPASPPLIYSQLLAPDRKAMEEDIQKLRPQVDVLVVSMHCGISHVPAMIAMYQKEAAHAAIDSGADLVLQHHAHILKGIEVYRDKAIFYGLGNFAMEHHLPTPGRVSWDHSLTEYRGKVLKIKPAPGYEKLPWHPDTPKTMIAKAYIQNKRIQKVTYIPAYINPNLEPEVLTRQDPRAQEVFDYVSLISETEELDACFAWVGDEVLVEEKIGQPK